jgi:hypothetical protein
MQSAPAMHGADIGEDAMLTRQVFTRLMPVPVLLSLLLGCARYPTPMAFGPVTEPRASWSIRAGKDLNERDVCRSDADQRCVLTASSEQEPMSVVVSIYLHPIGDAPITYQGALVATFMGTDGRTAHESQVDLTIEPGRRPTGLATTGLLTSTPGRYVFKMSLLARVATNTDPHQFEETIPVEVITSS